MGPALFKGLPYFQVTSSPGGLRCHWSLSKYLRRLKGGLGAVWQMPRVPCAEAWRPSLLYNVVLLGSFNKAGINVKRHRGILEHAPKVCVDKIRLLIRHDILNNVLPVLPVRFIKQLHLSIVVDELVVGEICYRFGLHINQILFLAEVENIWLVPVDSVAILFDFEHALRLPVGKLSVDVRIVDLVALIRGIYATPGGHLSLHIILGGRVVETRELTDFLDDVVSVFD